MKNCFVTPQKESYCICDVTVSVTLQKQLSTHRNSQLKRTRVTTGSVSLETGIFFAHIDVNYFRKPLHQSYKQSLFLDVYTEEF